MLQVDELNNQFTVAFQVGESMKKTLANKRDLAVEALNNRYQELVDQLTRERDEQIAKAESICDLKTKEIDDYQSMLKRVSETLMTA